MKRILAFLLLLSIGVLLGASETGETHATPHHFNWAAFFGKVINALILFGGIYVIMRKPFEAQLAKQSVDVRRDIEDREADIQTHQASMDELQVRLRNLEAELQAMRETAAVSGREQMDQLENLGREETRRIVARTEAEITLRMEAAMKQLKARIADAMIARFAGEFQEQADEDIHNRLIDRGIDQAETIDDRK